MTTLIKPAEVVNTGTFRAAPVNARFDINVISPHIQSAEERFIIPILTKDLYNDMVAQQNPLISNYNPDAGALVDKFLGLSLANYESLWELYLLRLVSYCVYYESLPFITFQVGSKGIFQNNSEFAENGGISSVKYMQDVMMQRIENLTEIVKKYLCDNKTDFPLFSDHYCPCNNCDDCNDYCHCGYYNKYLLPCPTCKVSKNNSTNIIFY